MWVPVEARRVTDPLKLDLQVAMSCYELNQGLHQGLLTAEPFLQLWFCYFYMPYRRKTRKGMGGCLN